MNLTINRTAAVKRTARVLQLEGLFDIAPSQRSERTWQVALPLDSEPWQIGLIVGPSGSGKTTLAREAFKDAPFVSANVGYDWPADGAVVDGFPAELSIKDPPESPDGCSLHFCRSHRATQPPIMSLRRQSWQDERGVVGDRPN